MTINECQWVALEASDSQHVVWFSWYPRPQEYGSNSSIIHGIPPTVTYDGKEWEVVV